MSIGKSKGLFLVTLFAIGFMAAGAYILNAKIEKDYRNQVGKALTAVLNTTQQAVHSWVRENKATVKVWAGTPEVRQLTRQLLNTSRKRTALLDSPAQARMRRLLKPLYSANGYAGFFIIASDHINLSSSRDENIGVTSLLTLQSDFFNKINAGKPALSLPQRSDVPLPGEDGKLRPGIPTMFVAAPVYSETGNKIIAILAFRISPFKDFTAIFQRGRIGDTGESYAFDASGQLISESRFDTHLYAAGLIEQGQRGILNITLRDPGVNLLVKPGGRAHPEEQPLTRMAQSAISGESLMDLNSYRDYRGIDVVGAWLWDKDLNFGIASEINVSEAYSTIYVNRRTIIIISSISIFLLVLMGYISHISRRRIEKSELKYRRIVETANEGIWVIDAEGLTTYVNQTQANMLGYHVDEMSGSHLFDFMDKEGRGIAALNIERRKQGISEEHEFKFRKKDGSYIWVNISTNPIIDDSGRYNGALGMVTDITERKTAEELLRYSEQQLRLITDGVPAPISYLDTDLHYQFNNRAYEEWFSIPRDEIKGKHVRQLLGDKAYEIVRPHLLNALKGNIAVYETSLTYKDGSTRYVRMNYIPHIVNQDVVKGIIVLINDLTERKHSEQEREKLQQQLNMAHKMEALGHLSGGIAHDFNNILTSILGYADLAIGMYPDIKNDVLIKYLGEIRNAGERARGIISQMLTFSRNEPGIKSSMSLASLLTESVSMLRPSIPSSIEINTHIEEKLPDIMIDSVKIYQLIMNLVVNARDALDGKGVIDIILKKSIAISGTCQSCHTEFQGDFLELVIRDSGAGINNDVMKHMFEPFFTIKEIGKGTGMGLPIVHGIIHEHNGHITLETTPGKGAAFHVLFPVTTQVKARSTKTRENEDREITGKLAGHILVVDDERSIAEYLKLLLNHRGYDVDSTIDSTDALEQITSDPCKYDLIITDQTMPKLTGKELAHEILKVRPDMPIILITGYSEALDEDQALSLGIKAFVTKPLNSNQLVTIINRLITQPDH